MKKHENSTVVDEYTLEMVLEDKVPSPFSLQDFITYLNQTYCTENLAFYLAVSEYRTTSQFFFGPTVIVTTIVPTSVRLVNGQYFTFEKNQYHLLAPEERSCFDYMIQQFDTIIDQFIQINANQEINIPADMKQQLLINAQHGCYHPALLAPAYTSILGLLRISAFIPFITDPQRLAIFSSYASNAFSLSPPSSSSNITFTSTLSSSTSITSTSSSSSSLASVSCPTVPRPAYFSRSSSNPGQPPQPQPSPLHFSPLPPPWTLRRLKSSPSLNTITPDALAPPPPLPLPPLLHPSISCRSSSADRPRSVHTVTDDNDNDKPLLKKWASPFRRSPSPQQARPVGGWRQITVHDSPLFKQPSCLVSSPSRPSS